VTQSFAHTRRVLCAGLLCAAALYFAPPARSQSCDTPGNAGIDQYCDPLDPPPGALPSSHGQTVQVPGRTRDELEHGSTSAQGALALSRTKGVADPIVPAAPAAQPPAPGAPAASATSESGPTAGAGFVAVIAALAIAVGVLAWLARRRRRV
jgi:hypothetical protein